MAPELNDEVFLDYCYYHSQTPRHMFAVADAKRLLLLTGEKADIDKAEALKHLNDNDIVGMDVDFVHPRVEKARQRLKKPIASA